MRTFVAIYGAVFVRNSMFQFVLRIEQKGTKQI